MRSVNGAKSGCKSGSPRRCGGASHWQPGGGPDAGENVRRTDQVSAPWNDVRCPLRTGWSPFPVRRRFVAFQALFVVALRAAAHVHRASSSNASCSASCSDQPARVLAKRMSYPVTSRRQVSARSPNRAAAGWSPAYRTESSPLRWAVRVARRESRNLTSQGCSKRSTWLVRGIALTSRRLACVAHCLTSVGHEAEFSDFSPELAGLRRAPGRSVATLP